MMRSEDEAKATDDWSRHSEEIAADCLFEPQGNVAEALRLARRYIVGEDDYRDVPKLIEAAAERVTTRPILLVVRDQLDSWAQMILAPAEVRAPAGAHRICDPLSSEGTDADRCGFNKR